MGDRIAIRFVNSTDKTRSPYLYSHGTGINLAKTAKKYVRALQEKYKIGKKGWQQMLPLGRGEPDVAMVDFIAKNIKAPVEHDFRLEEAKADINPAKEHGADDNGTFEFDLVSDKIVHNIGEFEKNNIQAEAKKLGAETK